MALSIENRAAGRMKGIPSVLRTQPKAPKFGIGIGIGVAIAVGPFA
jgi:hypothetical protein